MAVAEERLEMLSEKTMTETERWHWEGGTQDNSKEFLSETPG